MSLYAVSSGREPKEVLSRLCLALANNVRTFKRFAPDSDDLLTSSSSILRPSIRQDRCIKGSLGFGLFSTYSAPSTIAFTDVSGLHSRESVIQGKHTLPRPCGLGGSMFGCEIGVNHSNSGGSKGYTLVKRISKACVSPFWLRTYPLQTLKSVPSIGAIVLSSVFLGFVSSHSASNRLRSQGSSASFQHLEERYDPSVYNVCPPTRNKS